MSCSKGRSFARAFNWNAKMHSLADFIGINPERKDMSRVKCRVIGIRPISDLLESAIPAVRPTIPSPLQYGYRPKITPHLRPPPKKGNKMQSSSTSEGWKQSWPKIGIIQTGKRVVMDTKRPEQAHWFLPQSGSTQRYSGANSPTATGVKDSYVCIADHKATVRECIGVTKQALNKTTVPGRLASYVRNTIFRGSAEHPTASFTQAAGIGLSPDPIRFATHDVELDALAHEISFRSGERRAGLQRTALDVGSPRKGCDAFVRRLPAPSYKGVVPFIRNFTYSLKRWVLMVADRFALRGRYFISTMSPE
ncbi:S-adenosyl-L-methionine-dependent methyltransferase [Lactarius deliciosus]|nr:S-adenosyl-L-methionine-dependent methyltransferase [Lactarius deliciosus]